MAVKVDVRFQPGFAVPSFDPPRIPGATLIGKACCEHVRLFTVVAADGLPAIEAYCMAQRYPSMLLRDGKVIGTSA